MNGAPDVDGVGRNPIGGDRGDPIILAHDAVWRRHQKK